jgi:hypothetical protein
MLRLLAFTVSLLLLGGWVDPTKSWLIALVVLAGLAALRVRWHDRFELRPAVDLRLAAFLMATLLLAGAIEPVREWLIGLSLVTGLAWVRPRLISIDVFGRADSAGGARHEWAWMRDDERAWRRADRAWNRWERRMDARLRRIDAWGDDTP